ncbi:HAD hydrolase family protein [Terasakiella sp. A23]|uniref:KdsC family phosphatase n=1 Tax=Terasakiella sp. FCG-A23 TaxID=3080561 RepID=UPI0029557E14|nr:HAD hydrolase family protein [Terasakiella sp. A23]MDV7340799.1 HAD hydrolase family protein [Terasakiella sp. A23]
MDTIAFDFDGIFTDNKVWVDETGRESVRCDRGDGLAFDFVRVFQAKGLMTEDIFILSKETNDVVNRRAAKMKLKCQHATKNKLTYMEKYLSEKHPARSDIWQGFIYVGNDLNDLPLMRKASYGVAPSDAHQKVKDVADLVLPERGGEGFVRAFVERLLRINQMTDRDLDELISNC